MLNLNHNEYLKSQRGYRQGFGFILEIGVFSRKQIYIRIILGYYLHIIAFFFDLEL